jgi:hypothetical protein
LHGISMRDQETDRRTDPQSSVISQHYRIMDTNHFAVLTVLIISCTILSCTNHEPSSPKPVIVAKVLSSPEAVVKAFCDFDSKGRMLLQPLSEEDRAYYRGLIIRDEDPDLDDVTLIADYTLGEIRKRGDAAKITVIYKVKGKYSPDNIKIFNKYERITYKVAKTEEGWKIEGPVVSPHLYPKTLIAALGNRMKYANGASEKVKYQKDINLIKNLKYFSFAKKETVLEQ